MRSFQINNQQGEIVEEKERKEDYIYIFILLSIYIVYSPSRAGILDLSYKVHPLVNEPYSPLVDQCLL